MSLSFYLKLVYNQLVVYIVGIIVCVLFLASSVKAETPCKFVINDIEKNNAVICSFKPIAVSMDIIHDIFRRFNNYEKFLKVKGKIVSKCDLRASRVGINIVSFNFLNTNRFHHQAVGRYFPEYNIIYTTPRSLEPRNTDLPHELAHFYNDECLHLTEAQDEQLAQQYETYYLSHLD